ncbi:MAG: hypothetical protein HYY76_16025 [Acidobacteria bacterium]|nr:hypothetical protein [Acidobacteriota bacterium]
MTLYRRFAWDRDDWWSTWEALWANMTLFDRARPMLRIAAVRELTLGTPALVESADLFALRV